MSDTAGQGSPLRIVIDESLVKSKPSELPVDYAERGAFSERTTELRHRTLALCRDRVSKELVKESEFDGVFKAIQAFWDKGPLTGTGPDKAFLAAQTAIENAEERVAAHLRALEEWQRQQEVFADRRDRPENRGATPVGRRRGPGAPGRSSAVAARASRRGATPGPRRCTRWAAGQSVSGGDVRAR